MDGANPEQVMQGTLEELSRRMAASADPRLAQVVHSLIDHAHQLVCTLRPTQDELRTALEFLTEVGHASDARRQEWVLLADVIGLSQLVEDINAPRPEGATPNALPGPFYRPAAPELPNGANLSRDGLGAPLAVTGRVTDISGAAILGALVEVWHANGEGLYENQEPDLQPEWNLRGRLRTDAAGRFHFATIRPKGLALPDDGPVGRLMTALGLRLERPAHLQFRISAPGFQTLTTNVFDRDDPAIGHDALFGVKPALLAQFRTVSSDGAPQGFALDVAFALARTGQSGRAHPTP